MYNSERNYSVLRRSAMKTYNEWPPAAAAVVWRANAFMGCWQKICSSSLPNAAPTATSGAKLLLSVSNALVASALHGSMPSRLANDHSCSDHFNQIEFCAEQTRAQCSAVRQTTGSSIRRSVRTAGIEAKVQQEQRLSKCFYECFSVCVESKGKIEINE